MNTFTTNDNMEDKMVNRVLEAYKMRSNEGIEKYGTTLERDDLNVLDWLQHLQEELMDATLYIEALKGQKVGIDAQELKIEDILRTYVEDIECLSETPEEILSYAKPKFCLITGVQLKEEDTYNINTGCPYSNFAEKFRARHQIPVRDLRRFVEELKSKL